jgi:hypothetical protein
MDAHLQQEEGETEQEDGLAIQAEIPTCQTPAVASITQ